MSFTSLIVASIEQNNDEYIKKINVEMLDVHEREVVEYLRQYTKDYGSLPTEDLFRKSEYGDYWGNYLKGTPIKHIYELTMQRAVYDYSRKTIQDLVDEYNMTGEMNIEELKSRIKKITTPKDVKKPKSLGKIKRKEYYTSESANHLPFGIPTIDHHTGGMKLGDYSLLFAPTNVGKTTLTAMMAVRVALGGGKVLYNPREITEDEIMEKIDAILGSFCENLFNKATDEDKEELKNKLTFVEQMWEKIYAAGGDIHIPDKTNPIITPTQLQEAIRIQAETGNPYDLVIIDGVYEMSVSGNEFVGNDWGAFAALSSQLKRVAKNGEYPTRLLVTSQVKAGFEEKKLAFTLADIGFSKSIKNDFNFIIAMGQQDAGIFAKRITENETPIFFNLLKNRKGSTNPIFTNSQAVLDFATSQIRFDVGGLHLGTPMATTPIKIV